jgi:hypothetical protein
MFVAASTAKINRLQASARYLCRAESLVLSRKAQVKAFFS